MLRPGSVSWGRIGAGLWRRKPAILRLFCWQRQQQHQHSNASAGICLQQQHACAGRGPHDKRAASSALRVPVRAAWSAECHRVTQQHTAAAATAAAAAAGHLRRGCCCCCSAANGTYPRRLHAHLHNRPWRARLGQPLQHLWHCPRVRLGSIPCHGTKSLCITARGHAAGPDAPDCRIPWLSQPCCCPGHASHGPSTRSSGCWQQRRQHQQHGRPDSSP